MARGPTFTSYIRSELDPRTGAAYGQMAAIANRTYDQIERRALAASRGTARVEGAAAATRGAAAAGAARQIDRMADAERRLANSTATTSTSLRRANTEMRATEIQGVRMARSLDALATTLNVVQGPLGPLAGRVRSVSTAIQELTGFRLGMAAIGASVFAFARSANKFTEIESKLRPLYESQREVNTAMERTVQIAAASRAPLSATVDLYSKLTAAGRDFGISQERVNRVTRLSAQAATLSGGSAQAREAGLYQFAQGLSSGILAGDELKSIRENATELARAIATGLGVQIGDLKKLGEQGVLTTETVVTAIERADKQIEERFARLPKTLSTAGTEIGNAFTVMVGRADKAIGVTSTLAETMSIAAEHMQTLVSLAAGAAAAFVLPKLGSFIANIVRSTIAYIEMRRAVAAGNATLLTAEGIAAAKAKTEAKAALAARRAEIQKQADIERTIATLRQEQAAYASLIPQIERQAAASAAMAASAAGARAAGQFGGSGGAEAAALRDTTALARTRFAARRVAADLAEQEKMLAGQLIVTGQASNTARASIQRMGLAKAAASKAASLLTGAMTLLRGSLPTLIIFGLVTVLVDLATAQGDAERASESATQSMQDYSDIVDQATGKVRELTRAERERTEATAKENIDRFRSGDPGMFETQNDSNVGGGAYARLAGRLIPNVTAPYRDGRILTPDEIARMNREVAEAERWTKQLSRGGDEAAAALKEIEAGAKAGRAGLRLFQEEMAETITRVDNLRIAAENGRKALGLVGGATDPAFLERQAQGEAELAAKVEDTTRAYERRAKRVNTLGGNAAYQQNLEQAYKDFGVPSPEDLEKIRTQIATLRRLPVPKGQEETRRGAIAEQERQLARATATQEKYRRTIEHSARTITDAEDAQRDHNKALQEEEKRAREAERAERERVRALEEAARRTEQLRSIEERYDPQPRMVDRARKDMREVERLVGQTVNGIRHVTQGNQLGAGIFNIDDLRRVRREIDEGLRQPFREILEDYAREEEVLRAVVQGREAEADALRDKQRLIRDVGGLELGQYEALLRAAQRRKEIEKAVAYRDRLRDFSREEEVQIALINGRSSYAEALRIEHDLLGENARLEDDQFAALENAVERQEALNRILADRERLVSNLTGVVDSTREAVEQLLATISPEKALSQGKTFLKTLMGNFQAAGARILTDRLFGGVDQKIRDLVTGRNTVEGAAIFVGGQFRRAGGAAGTLADGLAAAEARVNGLFASTPTSPGAAAGPLLGQAPTAATIVSTAAAVTSAISSKLRIGNPLRSMFVGGDNFAQHVARGSSGVDLRASIGTSLYAPFEGTLTTNRTRRGGLQAFVTSLDGRVKAGFAHLESIIGNGIRVQVGQKIGTTGNSGINPATGQAVDPHLHSSLYVNGVARDPMRYFGKTIDFGGVAQHAAETARALETAQDRTAGVSDRMADLSQVVGTLTDDMGALSGTAVDAIAALLGVAAPGGGGGSGDAMKDRATAFAKAIGDSLDTDPAVKAREAKEQRPPTLREVYNQTGAAIGAKLDEALGTKFFKGIGGQLGNALQGAQTGSMVAGVMKAVGIKTSTTGAQIGGAAGKVASSITGIPGLEFVGAFLGGTIGGMLKKAKTGASTLQLNQFGELEAGAAFGTNSAMKKAATGLAGSVSDTINQITDTLDATISGIGNITIGVRDGKVRVNTGGTSLKTSKGAIDFGEDEQAAIEFAVKQLIGNAVISGISQASINIIKSGQDLQKAVEKAALIESIPKRLMKIQDPVRYAITELNKEFDKIIQALIEGKATAEQYAQAQQLYDIERARTVKEATDAASSAIQQYLDNMLNSQQSPLNKATVYGNAMAKLQTFVPDIQAGKIVDQGDLVAAAQNFQDASRALNGSSQAFFSDFDMLRALLEQARTNAGIGAGTVETLPASPFSGTAVQDAIGRASNAQVDAVDRLNRDLGGSLKDILDAIRGAGGYGGMSGFGGGGSVPSAMDLLPAYRSSGGGGFGDPVRTNSA